MLMSLHSSNISNSPIIASAISEKSGSSLFLCPLANRYLTGITQNYCSFNYPHVNNDYYIYVQI